MYRSKATRVVMGLLLASAMFGTSGGAVAADTHQVNVSRNPGNGFLPEQVWGEVGDTVEWTYRGGKKAHNVRQDNFLFRNDASDEAWTFTRVFSAGSFPYRCEVHPSSMRGTIKMPVTVHPDFDGDLPRVQWATKDSNTGRVMDVRFRVGRTGKWKNWKKDTKRNGAVFGRDGKPVQLARKTYWFKARSQKKGETSKWSPLKSYFHNTGGYGY